MKPATSTDIPVVAIGASAGGLEPISRLLARMPSDSGLAFVVIQHLDPHSKSLLPELLGRQTTMNVQPAAEGVRLLPNQIYVIPPGAHLTLESGRLHLLKRPEGAGAGRPINVFLHALAAQCGKRGVGVILSGSGDDGAEGLKALKQAGGLTLVQDLNEAQQDGMPRQAMLLAHPDYVIRVEDMPAVLARYVAHSYVKAAQPPAGEDDSETAAPPGLAPIIQFLRSAAGQDFERYKTGTLRRRIERRMALHGVHEWADYLALLRKSEAETDALSKDLLINVTRFFRDSETFSALAGQAASLLRTHTADQPVRIWVAGCSTGEEAYSLAMLLLEQIDATPKHPGLQVFATDIDGEALQIARTGVYPDSITSSVSPQRLKRFFVRDDGHFKVTKTLREAVIFSRHDILSDAPFSRLDLVSCRNLLIYLTPEAQAHVLALAHFALRDGGLLLLGSAESVSAAPGLFEPVDEKQRIFRRSGWGRSARTRFSMARVGQGSSAWSRTAHPPSQEPLSLRDLAQRTMLEVYAPAAVVTNRQLVPLYFFGAADRYLQFVPGEPGQDLSSIAREGLRTKLHDTIVRALRHKDRVAAHGVSFEHDGKMATVTIEAQRIADDHEPLVLVTFIDELPARGVARKPSGKGDDTPELVLLRQQLIDTRRELNRTIQELRETNEELKAKNEEAMSLNEEFLSTNEELESSKEELQSLNEELTTVNNQLRLTVEQRERTSTDLANLLDSSAVATIMLDAQLRIKVFNPRMKALFSLIDADLGRPLADLVPKFTDPRLAADAKAALATGMLNEREIRAESGAWYVRSSLPYRTEAGAIQGVVVTFADVSALKRAELEAAAARRYAETIIDTIHEPLVVFDADGKVVSANAAFCSAFDLPPNGIAGRAPRDLGNPILMDARLTALVSRDHPPQDADDPVELEAQQRNGGHCIWRATARRFHISPTERPLVLLTLENITDERRIVRQQLQLLIDALPGAFVAVDDGRLISFVSRQVESLFGYRAGDLIGQPIDLLVPPDVRAHHAELHASFLANPTRRPMGTALDIRGLTKDGSEIPLDIGLSPLATATGNLTVAAIHDLRPQKQGEAQLREARSAAEQANEAKSRFLMAAGHDLRQPLQIMALLHGLMGRRTTDPELRTILTRLDDSVAAMSDLLDTLLDIAQLESGAIRPEITVFPLAPLLARTIEDFAPMAAAKGLELRVGPTSASVRSDRRLLARIVGNLLSNAIKYTDHGRILVGCRRRGDTLRIEVWDTGIGIPADSMEAIFGEFHRVDRTDSGKFGLGLGLSIVQRFADLLGHTVEARSVSGKGSTFAVIVSGVRFAPARPKSSARPREARSSPPEILLVEDDPAQLAILGALLEFEGYRVTTAHTGAEVLAPAGSRAEARPDIIVTDFNLPGGVSGLDLILRLRERAHAEIPALIVSGDRSKGSRSVTEAPGIQFIAKPISTDDLITALGKLADKVSPGWQGRVKPRIPAPETSISAARADIAVIDDEPGVRNAIQMMLESEGYTVASYASGPAFLADANHHRFRCLVVDLNMPRMGGLELQDRLKSERSGAAMIFLTGNASLPMAVKAIREGGADFLQKPVRRQDLLDSIADALTQDRERLNHLVERGDVAAAITTLTEREHQVLEGVLMGKLNKNIAAELGISQRTTEHHRRSVMRKMGAKSLAALIRMVEPRGGG